jgi:hypothetical protein
MKENLLISLFAFIFAFILKRFEYKYWIFKDLFHFFIVVGFINLFKIIFSN